MTTTPPPEPERKCSNCHGDLKNLGIRNFHIGEKAGVIGALGETEKDLLAVELWGCVACGKVEMYLPHEPKKP